MLQLDGQVEREREADLTQHSNPEATSQSNGKPSPTPTRVQILLKNLLMRREGTQFLLDFQEMMKMPNLRLSRAMNESWWTPIAVL
jgi:hypothetical protein